MLILEQEEDGAVRRLGALADGDEAAHDYLFAALELAERPAVERATPLEPRARPLHRVPIEAHSGREVVEIHQLVAGDRPRPVAPAHPFLLMA